MQRGRMIDHALQQRATEIVKMFMRVLRSVCVAFTQAVADIAKAHTSFILSVFYDESLLLTGEMLLRKPG